MQTQPQPQRLGASLLVLLALVAAASAAAPRKLPDYLQRCSAKDPQLDKCVLKSGRNALPRIVKGDPALKLPPLDPLRVPEVRVQQGGRPATLDLTSRDLEVLGLAASSLDAVHVDLAAHFFTARLSTPRLELLAEYEVQGQVLVLPLRGNGRSNITLEGARMEYEQRYEVERRGSRRYIRTLPSTARLNCSRAHFYFGNLFSGDPRLGESVNRYLNENWRAVVDELSEPFLDVAAGIIRSFIDAVVATVPYEEVFLDLD